MSNMQDALVGYTGFVGRSLLRQTVLQNLFRSTNICEIKHRAFGTVVCSAAPAQKWIANQDPAADRKNIDNLISNLESVTCDTFILISTVDVFKTPISVDEDTVIDERDLHPYGLHRRLLEKFVEDRFANYLIVRLPGLVGPGLRKNVIFDFLNDNNLHAIDSRGVFQFYPIINLWYDIQIALKERLKLVHLTAEPISVREVAALGFNKLFEEVLANLPASYDMRTLYAELFGVTGSYQYNRRESIQAIRAYAQSEPRTLMAEGAIRK